MDISQITIKINQTNQSDNGKTKTSSQTEDLGNSFDQILAMFNFADKSLNSDWQSASSMQDHSIKDDQIHSITIDEEDGLQLDDILTSLVAGIQQLTNAPAKEDVQPVEFNMISKLHLDTTDINKSIAQFLQGVKGFNQTSTMDTDQLNDRFVQLLSEMQLQDKQKTFENPSHIKDKIQMILDEINTENNIDRSALINSKLDELILAAKKQDPGNIKPWVSLDKNQVMFSSLPETEMIIKGRSNFIRDPITQPTEYLTKINGQSFMGNLQLQVPDDSIASKTESSFPQLQVSEFTSEVSKWISGNLRIFNGQPGNAEVKFSLFPEHLGHIEIKITSEQGLVSARILTDTFLAKEALGDQLQQLKQSMLQLGITVQKLEIVQQTPVSMDLNQVNQSFSQEGSGSSHEQRTSQEQEIQKNQEDTDQQEIETETISLTYGGAAPNTASRIDFTA